MSVHMHQNYDGTNTPVWAEPGMQRAADLAAWVTTIEDTDVETINATQYNNMTQYLLEKVGTRRRSVCHWRISYRAEAFMLGSRKGSHVATDYDRFGFDFIVKYTFVHIYTCVLTYVIVRVYCV